MCILILKEELRFNTQIRLKEMLIKYMNYQTFNNYVLEFNLGNRTYIASWKQAQLSA